MTSPGKPPPHLANLFRELREHGVDLADDNLVEGSLDLAELERAATTGLNFLPGDQDQRLCLYIFDGAAERAQAKRSQCLEPATHACMNANGLQWFGCTTHADRHTHLRMPVKRFLELARAGRSEELRAAWQACPNAPEALRLARAPS